MFATNLILLLAFVAMIATFIWLMRDGEGPAQGPRLMEDKDDEADDTPAAPRIYREDEPPR